MTSSNLQSRQETHPQVSFYIDIDRPISKQECTFPSSHLFNRGTEKFCDDANISLTYLVTLQRSLSIGAFGTGTPDAKIVRISADGSGAGIHLNDQLDHREHKADYTVFDGFYYDWSTDVFAQNYNFNIKASNDKAVILKTVPNTNINSNFQNRELSGFEIGVSGGVEGTPSDPKLKLEGSYKYTQTRTLIYDTQDYRVNKANPSNREVNFRWEREQYATPESLFDDYTDSILNVAYPIDKNRIRPVGYSNFTPSFDVIYKASSNETGSTTFELVSSVQMRAVYASAYRHYYVVGAHVSYKPVEVKDKIIDVKETFDVDWNAPVFTGGYPVNLQLRGFNNQCINYNESDFGLSIAACELSGADARGQSFIYNNLGQYVSVINESKCLDGKNLAKLVNCNANLSQRWKWNEKDQLVNELNDNVLAHRYSELSLKAPSRRNSKYYQTLTSFTNLFGADDIIPVKSNRSESLLLQIENFQLSNDRSRQERASDYNNVSGQCTSEYLKLTQSREELQACTPIEISSYDSEWFYIYIPEDYQGEQLSINLKGGSGDADLYVSANAWPYEQQYEYGSANTGNNEQLIINNPSKGTYYYINVDAKSSFNNVTLEARL
ncbi:leukocidin family pore-forming toxin [Spartinivicinus sp. A2-2]|uniref:Leukocidin family pore-forming toxin n=1 Tax=Spartinivicinus poritis TaxID=2994640 RepID=A0ABT5UAV0_9GAMM|nr:leukocidin family pore-forming toxin [Spartinivicinus sp. A2-2]MDE1463492.1 leukocidin family pore-forming toxin [Spartinivicinus sp. A2-2]